jgi:hypothetical protein
VDEWSDWESGDFLHAADKPDAEVPLDEVLQRVAVGFRRVVIDWCEGDRWVDWRITKHIEVGSPPVIMEAEHARPDRSRVPFGRGRPGGGLGAIYLAITQSETSPH